MILLGYFWDTFRILFCSFWYFSVVFSNFWYFFCNFWYFFWLVLFGTFLVLFVTSCYFSLLLATSWYYLILFSFFCCCTFGYFLVFFGIFWYFLVLLDTFRFFWVFFGTFERSFPIFDWNLSSLYWNVRLDIHILLKEFGTDCLGLVFKILRSISPIINVFCLQPSDQLESYECHASFGTKMSRSLIASPVLWVLSSRNNISVTHSDMPRNTMRPCAFYVSRLSTSFNYICLFIKSTKLLHS